MQLRSHGFWAALYRDCRRIWLEFIGFKGDPRIERTDLCTFVRTIFVGTPLAIAANLAACGFAVYSVGLFLYVCALNLSGVGMVVLFVAAIAAFIGTVAGLIYGASAIAKAAERSETLHFAVEYAKAKKSKICPLITLDGETHEAA